MTKGKNHLLRLIRKLIFLSPYLYILAKEFAGILKLEAKAARKSFCGIIIYSILFSGLLLILWLSAMILIVLWLLAHNWSIELSILCTMAINFSLLITCSFLILQAKRHLLFCQTRNQLFKNKKFLF